MSAYNGQTPPEAIEGGDMVAEADTVYKRYHMHGLKAHVKGVCINCLHADL